MFKKGLFIFFLLIYSAGLAQNNTDSLIRVFEKTEQDTNYVNLANLIATKLRDSDPQQSISYSKKALETAEKLNFGKGVARSLIDIGWSYYRLGELDKAFENSQVALSKIDQLQSLPLKAEVLTNIAAIYNEQGNLERSLDYFQQSMNLHQKTGNDQGIGRCLNNLAFTNYKLQRYEVAKQFVKQSIGHNRDKNPYYWAFAVRTEGDIWYAEKNLEKALEIWEEAVGIAQKLKNNSFEIACLNRIAKAHFEQKNYEKSLSILEKSAPIARKYNFKTELSTIYLLYSQIYEIQGRYDKAFLFHKQFFIMHDSIFDENNTKKINQLQAHFESEQKEKEILLLKTQQAQDQLLYEKKTAQQQWIIFSILAALFTVGLIAYLTFRSRHKIQQAYSKLEDANLQIIEKSEEINQQKEEILQTLQVVNEQKNLIEKKNTDITASITYAFRIQNAILPKEHELQKHLDCFVFYRPKDIVSGDFYWFAEKVISGQSSVISEEMLLPSTKKYILAVADCTGHGVSGAFMTMIGNNILNQIVHDHEIHEPDQILNLMSPILDKTLLHSEGTVKDGMDISILTIERNTISQRNGISKISYAGAMNPLYYIENQEFKEIKADKVPIGGKREENFSYQKHELIFDAKFLMFDEENPTSNIKNPTFYLCSDGFQDQFGGDLNKKFMVGNFKKLLSEISGKPMAEQKQILEKTFDGWKGEQKQTDDVLVVGFRV